MLKPPIRMALGSIGLVLALAALWFAIDRDGLQPQSAASESPSDPGFRDVRGVTIRLDETAEKLVVLPIPMASLIIALDGSPRRIAAMHPQAAVSAREGMMGRMFPEAARIRSDVVMGAQFNPNVEALLSLRPDAVIQWSEPADSIVPMETAGLRVVALQNNPESEALNQRNLRIVATLLGREGRLAQILALHDQRAAMLDTALGSLAPASRPKVLYLRADNGTLRVAGGQTYQNFWISLAGGQNPALADGLSGLTPVSAEQILHWDPDFIFLSALDDMVPANLFADPVLGQTKAARRQQIYKVPHGGYRWDPASHESHLAWTWAALLLHPDRINIDLRADVAASYRLLYNYEVTDEDFAMILETSPNSQSRGYANIWSDH